MVCVDVVRENFDVFKVGERLLGGFRVYFVGK